MYFSTDRLELPRRLVHMSGVVLPLSYILSVVTWNQLGLILATLTVTVTVLEYLRLNQNASHQIYTHLTRPYEQDTIAGYAYYALGMSIAWVFFTPPAAIAGMLILAIGDPINGIAYNAQPPNSKRTFSVVVMYFTSLALALVVTAPAYGLDVGIATASGAALLGTIADTFKPTIAGTTIDDNLSIPIMAALGITTILALPFITL